ncbi:MAG: double zinc ribbon domain-containing protein, partial [Rhodocyclaceae bacterium]|nr:double zinc ribbon domain-containing protein [Rhodocyclaceae bacterium]
MRSSPMTRRLSISALLDRLLPQTCLLCQGRANDALCPGCQADLPILAGPLCPVCALPLASAAVRCGACQSEPPAYDASFAPLRYTFPADRLVLDLKFPAQSIARRLASADFLARRMLAGPHPSGDVIVVTPL